MFLSIIFLNQEQIVEQKNWANILLLVALAFFSNALSPSLMHSLPHFWYVWNVDFFLFIITSLIYFNLNITILYQNIAILIP